MTPLSVDEIVARYHLTHKGPIPQLRPVLARLEAAGLSVVDTDTDTPPEPTMRDVAPDVTLEEAKRRLTEWAGSQNEAVPSPAGLVPDPETPPGLYPGPVEDGVQTWFGMVEAIPDDGTWKVRGYGRGRWGEWETPDFDDRLFVQARRCPAATPTTERWTVLLDRETPEGMHDFDLCDGGRYVASFPSKADAERVAAALNAADPDPETTPGWGGIRVEHIPGEQISDAAIAAARDREAP